MLDNCVTVLKDTIPYNSIIRNNVIGYNYDVLKNILLLPPSEISEFTDNHISLQKADRILRLECFAIENQLNKKLEWFSKLDAVTSFVLIALAKLTSLRNVLAQTEVLHYINSGKFALAAKELEKQGVNERLVRILETGRVR